MGVKIYQSFKLPDHDHTASGQGGALKRMTKVASTNLWDAIVVGVV